MEQKHPQRQVYLRKGKKVQFLCDIASSKRRWSIPNNLIKTFEHYNLGKSCSKIRELQYYTPNTIRQNKNNFSILISMVDQYLQLHFLVYFYSLQLFMMPIKTKSIQMRNITLQYYTPSTMRQKKNKFSILISMADRYLLLRFLVYFYSLEIFMMPIKISR